MTISKELKEVRAQKREILKEERRLKSLAKLENDLERWKELTELKQSFISRLRESKHSRGYSLTKLGKMKEYYIFQNPKDKKQKAVDSSEEWVKDYCSSGGNNGEADLISQANKTRLNVWRRMNPKMKRKTKPKMQKLAKKLSSGKSAAIKQQGVG
jgi:hypothetical protein